MEGKERWTKSCRAPRRHSHMYVRRQIRVEYLPRWRRVQNNAFVFSIYIHTYIHICTYIDIRDTCVLSPFPSLSLAMKFLLIIKLTLFCFVLYLVRHVFSLTICHVASIRLEIFFLGDFQGPLHSTSSLFQSLSQDYGHGPTILVMRRDTKWSQKKKRSRLWDARTIQDGTKCSPKRRFH